MKLSMIPLLLFSLAWKAVSLEFTHDPTSLAKISEHGYAVIFIDGYGPSDISSGFDEKILQGVRKFVPAACIHTPTTGNLDGRLELIKNFISNILMEKDINGIILIAHSRGVVDAKNYVNSLGDFAKDIKAFFSFGAPYEGSDNAEAVLYWAGAFTQLPFMQPILDSMRELTREVVQPIFEVPMPKHIYAEAWQGTLEGNDPLSRFLRNLNFEGDGVVHVKSRTTPDGAVIQTVNFNHHNFLEEVALPFYLWCLSKFGDTIKEVSN